GAAVCSVNVIRGGSAINIIPDHCEIEIDRRLVPGEQADEASAALASLLAYVDVEHGIHVDVAHPPLSDAENGDVAMVAQRVLRDMGLPALCVGAPFATHASYLAAPPGDASSGPGLAPRAG